MHVNLFVGENIPATFPGSRRDLNIYLNAISTLVNTTMMVSTEQPQDNDNGSSRSSTVGIIIGCIAVVIILILGVAVFIVCKHSIQRPFPKTKHSSQKSYSIEKDADQANSAKR